MDSDNPAIQDFVRWLSATPASQWMLALGLLLAVMGKPRFGNSPKRIAVRARASLLGGPTLLCGVDTSIQHITGFIPLFPSKSQRHSRIHAKRQQLFSLPDLASHLPVLPMP
jgi:hypothetical protein